MVRLNLNVKFMVLIISVSVLFVKFQMTFFLSLPCFLASGVLLLWEYFRAMGELYTKYKSVSQVPHVIPSPLGFEADSEKDCNNVILHSFSMNSKYFLCSVLLVGFFSCSATACMQATVPHTAACFNKISFSLTSGAEVAYHHGLKAVTNKT